MLLTKLDLFHILCFPTLLKINRQWLKLKVFCVYHCGIHVHAEWSLLPLCFPPTTNTPPPPDTHSLWFKLHGFVCGEMKNAPNVFEDRYFKSLSMLLDTFNQPESWSGLYTPYFWVWKGGPDMSEARFLHRRLCLCLPQLAFTSDLFSSTCSRPGQGSFLVRGVHIASWAYQWQAL